MARVLLSSSKPGDLVIDPFNGTGTTGAVAKRLGRNYIGFERDQTYATAAEARIAAIEPLPEATLAPFMTARDAPRVAFSELIERGMISPGTKLVDSRKRHGALVRADGAIMLGDKVGSIHRIGAVAQGSGACNGWTFWHIETKKGLRLIDELRAEIRSGMAAGLIPLFKTNRHSGMVCRTRPQMPIAHRGISNSGFALRAPRNDGFFLTNSSVAHPAKFEHGRAVRHVATRDPGSATAAREKFKC